MVKKKAKKKGGRRKGPTSGMTKELADLCRVLYGPTSVYGEGVGPYRCRLWNQGGKKGQGFRNRLRVSLTISLLPPDELLAHKADLSIKTQQYHKTFTAKHGPRPPPDATSKKKDRLSREWKAVKEKFAEDNEGVVDDVEGLYETMYAKVVLELQKKEGKRTAKRILANETKNPPSKVHCALHLTRDYNIQAIRESGHLAITNPHKTIARLWAGRTPMKCYKHMTGSAWARHDKDSGRVEELQYCTCFGIRDGGVDFDTGEQALWWSVQHGLKTASNVNLKGVPVFPVDLYDTQSVSSWIAWCKALVDGNPRDLVFKDIFGNSC